MKMGIIVFSPIRVSRSRYRCFQNDMYIFDRFFTQVLVTNYLYSPIPLSVVLHVCIVYMACVLDIEPGLFITLTELG